MSIKQNLSKKLIDLTGKPWYYYRIELINNIKRLIFPKRKHKYLFILSPPYCGSTLLSQLISTSSQVSTNNPLGTGEGQQLPILRDFMFDTNLRWKRENKFDWELIKSEWEKYWDPTKPIWLEKSPPNIQRAQTLKKYFKPAYFIVFTRDPLAQCESLMSRGGFSAKQAAEFAKHCLNLQEKNRSLENSIQLTYEELADDPGSAVKKLIDFLPELSDINFDIKFRAHNFKSKPMRITNLNAEKIAKISKEDREVIEEILNESY